MSEVTTAEWLTITAIILSPVIAVLVSLFVSNSRMKADRRAQRQEDLFFKMLDYIDLNEPENAPKFARAVFQIPYIFNDKTKIREAQKQFLSSAQSAGGDPKAFSQAAIELLLTIARESKYKHIEESNIRLRYHFKAEKRED